MVTFDLIEDDCLAAMRELDSNSVDAIVTDPPYGLSFMGKRWDYDVPGVDVWAECLRVLKPGGHLLAFAGTRTQHRMAVRIEDAGFEIRDLIAWVYGSGFPKSLNISKSIDKKPELAHTRKFKLWLAEQIEKSNKTRSEIDAECGFTACSYAKTDGKDGWSSNHPSKEKWSKMKEVIGLSDEWDWVIIDNVEERGLIEPTGGLHGGTGNTVGKWEGSKQLSDNAISPDAKQWQGWGTALKPALEPITVARKPLCGTVAENVLAHGTGALNIDGCRVESGGEHMVKGVVTKKTTVTGDTRSGAALGMYGAGASFVPINHEAGRWPANLIHDGSEEVLAAFPQASGQQGDLKETGRPRPSSGRFGDMAPPRAHPARVESDKSAARFFYCAKASKADRGEGNGHPTVKPTDLMRYLCRLVTPPGGVVLDPFMGSGSTGKAAVLEGFRFIGIEREPAYFDIAVARVREAYAT